MQLTNRIHKSYNVSVTYQAVRKATESLQEQGVLEKEGKSYKLSKVWVRKTKAFFDNLLTTMEGNADVHFLSDAIKKEDYAVYTFHNLLDLDNFWGDVMRNWADELRKGDDNIFFSYYNYDFWFLINLGRETSLWKHLMHKGVKPYILVLRDLPLNAWGVQVYGDAGINVRLHTNHKIPDTMDCNVLGDLVLQVKYPDHLIKKLRSFYAKYKNTQEMSLREITELAHQPSEIKFILFKNPAIARDIKEKYLPLFSSGPKSQANI